MEEYTEKNGFVHVHVHSEESDLDGLSTIQELVQKAKKIKSPALGLTDHGVMAGIPGFIEECHNEGVHPLPGIEAYMTKNRLIRSDERKEMEQHICRKLDLRKKTKIATEDKELIKKVDEELPPRLEKVLDVKKLKDFVKTIKKDPASFETEAYEVFTNYFMEDGGDDLLMLLQEENEEEKSEEEKMEEVKETIYDYIDHDNFHLLLLAKDNQGLEDLYEISSDAHIHGFYKNPRTDLEYIRNHHLGDHLIATSACLGGYFAKLCQAGREEEAKAFIEVCKSTFSEFYLEKQATRIPDQLVLNDIIDRISIETDTPKIVTTDVHFASREDHSLHDILVAASMKKCVSDDDRYTYAEDHYMKTTDEIRDIFHDEEAIANTIALADKVHVTLPEKPLFPRFPMIEEDGTVDTLLKKKAWDNLFQYMLRNPHLDSNQYAERMNHELDVIIGEGFADYFLIEEDLIKATKEAGFLVGPGRGSGAGSLVCFMLGITTLDPISNNLLFERFLNPERVGYPDVDSDYSYNGARWALEYLIEKYGQDHVAQIGTKGTLAAKAAIRLTGKALGHDLQTEDDFAKAIPGDPGIKLAQAYEEEDRVKTYAKAFPEWWEAATKLEGHIRSRGSHAGGIVISPEKLTKVTPLRTDKNDVVTTELDMGWIEKFLVKFDILKLDTLDLIKDTMVNAGIWGEMDVEDIPMEDPDVFKGIYHSLNLSGIFQCESELFQGIIDEMKPTSFEEISIILALGRPGPLDLIPSYINRKFGREKVEYPFESLKGIMEDTYGIWVYQEMIMQASQVLGGFTLGQADILRKAISKKKHELIEEWIGYMIYGSEEKGIEGAIRRGYDEQTLLHIKKDWISFGNYALNESVIY